MTAVSRGCAERNCPGRVDQDGFCRLWGHECAGASAGSDVVDGPAREPAPDPRPPRTASRPWERPAVLPTARPHDPLSAVVAQPVVPEHSRYCPQTTCRRRLPRVAGYCPDCGTRYSFTPPLADGDLRAGRYRIEGCLGNGGVGWVFLARDEDMDGAWRVLKGQRNPEDREAAAAFVAERQALIALNHPRIVTITHALRPESDRDVGYLVMEYVDGGSLEEARSTAGPGGGASAVDVAQALGYGVQILDAFEYLHDQGWLYCDLKPENVMRVGGRGAADPIKLVDFGAARRIDNTVSPAWGTAGFTAPEVERLGPAGPSVRSDLYTVGRTLAALTLVPRSVDVTRIPAGQDVLRLPVPARLDPFLRLLARATAADPDDRFGSAAEMREQVRGVRRQVSSAGDGVPRPTRSTLFSPSACAFGLHTDGDALDVVEIMLGLPAPLVDGADPAAGFLASLGPADPAELVELLKTAPERTAQVTYRAVRALLAAGRADEAGPLLADFPEELRDWSLWWHRGLVALVGGDLATARRRFEQVYGWLPGEVSTRLAYAVACELDGDPRSAADHYRGVWDADPGVVAAAFGLARCLLAAADPRGAADALLRVPESSRASTVAVTCAVRILLDAPDDGRRLDAAIDAAATVDKLPPFGEREEVEAHILRIALGCDLTEGRHDGRRLFGQPLDEDALRRAFERRCRSRARRTADRRERIALVDLANAYRPVTWW
ncbi:serine/threonine-protein kinase PknG [Micromonospora citrea]|uniref:non-specific serine/threonine protein kinase n=1 Tax=Micromonospora citrea TaxID=47855 RepID=A0A1C6W0M3_9ACTN|nr:serine/threonine-protein kinase [Micromonospora citrea]SCL72113.1 serine/threonine-protein kinase PknG [Micromonospora citrea]